MASDGAEPDPASGGAGPLGADIDLEECLGERVLAWPKVDANLLATTLEALPEPGVGVVLLRSAPGSGNELVSQVASLLERSVVDAVPAWLPEVDELYGNPALVHAAAGAAALPLARELDLSAALLRAVVDAHHGDRSALDALRSPVQERLPQFAVLLQRAQRVARVITIVDLGDPAPGVNGQGVEYALRWLSGPGGLSVWACGPACRGFTSIPLSEGTITGGAPEASTPVEDPRTPPGARLTPFEGLPHPWSDAEQRLERALQQQDWAADRCWNWPWQASTLGPRYRLDLLFPGAECVIEIDGREHREAGKFQDDRRRDRVLQAHGLRVLRFTNEEVMTDVEAVLAEIAQLVRTSGSVERNPR